MKHFKYRPWGRPGWLLGHAQIPNWVVIACLSTETRSVHSALEVAKRAEVITLVEIDDPGSLNDEKRRAALDSNLRTFRAGHASEPRLIKSNLKASLDEIESIVANAIVSCPNVILDITSFPKRWFFPIIRSLVEKDSVRNLHVIYTRGVNYAEVLSENPETLRMIPSFAAMEDRSSHDCAFVGVGFHTQNLVTMFGDEDTRSLHVLFPFPPGPPNTKRNWKFVQQVEQIILRDRVPEADDPIQFVQLEAVDVSHVFDLMRITTDNGDKTSILAPYGPKTFSLAMCLFAIAADEAGKVEVPVYYSQPQRYALNYTGGVALQNGEIDSWAYAIKSNGQLLYKM